MSMTSTSRGTLCAWNCATRSRSSCIGVVPVAGPPGSEGEAWRQGNFSGDAGVVAEGLLVVVTIAEEVPILALAGSALDDPGPDAVSGVEAEVGGVKDRGFAVVDDCPSVARDEALFQLSALADAVECARGAVEISCGRCAGFPGLLRAVELEGDAEVIRRELARAFAIAQLEGGGVDDEVVVVGGLLEERDGELTVEDDEGWAILKACRRRSTPCG